MDLDAPSGILPFLVILAGGWSEEMGEFCKAIERICKVAGKVIEVHMRE
jgi:hypothetical protein